MGTKRTSSEGAVKKVANPAPKAAKLPPKRKVVARPKAVEIAVHSPVLSEGVTPGAEASVSLAPELIALRAYFISEQRQAEGRSGDSLTDWLEAERQLRSES